MVDIYKFQNEQLAKDFFDKTGFHYVRHGLDRYALTWHSSDMYNTFRNSINVQQKMGVEEDVGVADMSNVSLPFRLMRLDRDAWEGFKVPRPGETVPLFEPVPFEEMSRYLSIIDNKSSYYQEFRPSQNLVRSVDFDKGQRVTGRRDGRSRSELRSRETLKGYYRVIEDIAFNVDYDGNNIPGFGFNILIAETGKSEFKVFAAQKIDVSLVGNINGSLSLVINSNKQMTINEYGEDSSRLIKRAVDDMFEALDIRDTTWWKYVRAVIVNDAVCDEDYANLVKDSLGMHVFAKVKNVNTLFTTGHFNSIDDYKSKQSPIDESAFIRKWTAEALKTMHATARRDEDELDALKTKMILLAKTVGEKRRILRLVENSADTLFTNALADLKDVPLVRSVTFRQGVIVIETEDLFYSPRRGGKFASAYDLEPRYMGQFTLHLGIEAGYCYYINNHMPGNSAHTHVGSDSGSMCMGNYSHLISSAFESVDYENVVTTIMSMLQDTTEDDMGAYDELEELPKEKPATGKVSKQILVYGSMDKVAKTEDFAPGPNVDIEAFIKEQLARKASLEKQDAPKSKVKSGSKKPAKPSDDDEDEDDEDLAVGEPEDDDEEDDDGDDVLDEDDDDADD